MTVPAESAVRIEPWPSEKPLTIAVALVSFALWGALLLSIIGLVYGLMIGAFLFVAHVIFIAHVRGNAVRLGPDQFPDLHASVERLSRRFGFSEAPEAYLMQAGGTLNAFATRFWKANILILYSDLIEACGDNVAARDMVVAHELGHLKEGHLKWFWFMAPGLFFPFLGSALSRAREYTCDRYGLAGAEGKAGALTGLAILAAGAQRGPKINLAVMARQVWSLNAGWMTIGEWLSSHPPLAKRMIALDPVLRPSGDYSGRGILRALGILAGLYGIPVALAVLVAVGLGLSQLPRPRAKSVEGKIESIDHGIAAKRRMAIEDIQKLAEFLKTETEAGKPLPSDAWELHARYESARGIPAPRDPFTGRPYLFYGFEDGDFWIRSPRAQVYYSKSEGFEE